LTPHGKNWTVSIENLVVSAFAPMLETMNRHFAGALLSVATVGLMPSLFAQNPRQALHIKYDWEETVQQVFCPIGAIRAKPESVEFRAKRFTFTFLHRDASWRVEPAQNNVRPVPATNWVSIEKFQLSGFTVAACGKESREEGVLELRRGDCDGEVLGQYSLWTREEGAKAQLSDPKDLPEVLEYAEAAEPFVSGVASLQGHLWLAIGHYGSEGSRGVGTLVRLNPRDFTAELRKPPELADSTLGPMVAAGGRLWIGTFFFGEGADFPTHGLVEYDPSSGAVKSYLPGNSSIVGRLVLALAAEGKRLWVATENGICSVGLPEERWTCWRIVPTVEVTASTPVSSAPTFPPRGALKAGEYQVLWVKGEWLEVLTPDAVVGWERLESIRFGQPPFDDAHELLFDRDPFPPCDLLRGEPLDRAPFVAEPCRGRLERISEAAKDGWMMARARIGWINKGNLQIVPKLMLQGPKTTP